MKQSLIGTVIGRSLLLHFISALGGVIVMAVGTGLYLYPQGHLYHPGKLWVGILAVLYGLYIIIGNMWVLWKTPKEESK